MMGPKQEAQAALFYEFSLEDHVPQDHLLRSIDRFVDLSSIREHLSDFYSHTGRPSIDPELLIRMLLVGYCFGIRSERRLCEEVHLNLAYRWFCRLDLNDRIPDHSSFSKNRHGRFRESDLLRHVFETTVTRCMQEGLVGGQGFAVDASLISADVQKQNSSNPEDWAARVADANDAPRAVREYLDTLDDEAFGAATTTKPKFTAHADPASQWTAARKGPALSQSFCPMGVLVYLCWTRASEFEGEQLTMTIDFKGLQYPRSVILYAVFFYVRYGVSYRDLEEIMAERGIEVDHATLNRWVVKFSPTIAANAQVRKKPTAISWRMDETYIKVRGKWTYLYRAVDRDGQTLDFMLSERRDTAAARRFFKRAVSTNGAPDRIAIDKSGANLAGLQSLNVILKFTGTGRIIKIVQSKYLNNIVEQDHRSIKKITRPMLGFKAFYSAAATLSGIETAHMIRKGQLGQNGVSPFKQFAALAG